MVPIKKLHLSVMDVQWQVDLITETSLTLRVLGLRNVK